MLLRNRGLVACGESIEDALHLAFNAVIACETQACLVFRIHYESGISSSRRLKYILHDLLLFVVLVPELVIISSQNFSL